VDDAVRAASPTSSPDVRLVDLCPYGVFPPLAGGHRVVHHLSAALGARHEVFVFAMGLRRADGLHLRSFEQRPAGRYVEYRHVTPLTYLSYLRRRRTGLPPLAASRELAWLAPARLRRAIAAADLVQVEHPWQFAFARATATCPVVLVAHNAEAELLGELGLPQRLVARAAAIERDALARADAVVFLAAEDRARLEQAYGLTRPAAFHTIGVGVDLDGLRPATPAERAAAKAALGLTGRVALFAGSWHLPNRSAVEALRALAPRAPGWTFLVAGSVGRPEESGAGLRMTGPLADIAPCFRAADVALNPMSSGAGVNLKVLDYLAAGLPTVSTPFGARGLDLGGVVRVAELAEFPAALAMLADDRERARRGAEARALAEARFGWEAVARSREDVYAALAGRGAGG
jgi:glycosyltransferase involved in cell wall biosynthesis